MSGQASKWLNQDAAQQWGFQIHETLLPLSRRSLAKFFHDFLHGSFVTIEGFRKWFPVTQHMFYNMQVYIELYVEGDCSVNYLDFFAIQIVPNPRVFCNYCVAINFLAV